jgi:hypothetical protein
MTSAELIRLIKLNDPKGETEVKISVIGLVGGIGNPYARCPSIESVTRGFDWSTGMLILTPTVKLHAKVKNES